MPCRHGIRREDNSAVVLFGVSDLFEVLSRPPFRTTPLGNRHEPTNLAFHFRQVIQLFFYFLDMFQKKYRAFEQFLEGGALAGPNPTAYFDIRTEANAAAQGTLTNLNIILDDIARIIPYVIFREPTPKQILILTNGFSEMKDLLSEYSNTSTVEQLRTLFANLKDDASWWKLGFKYNIGLRSRFMHYPDCLVLSGSTPPGESKMRPNFELCRIGTPGYTVDFPAQLRMMLQGLCEWLDKLDAIMVERLMARAKEDGFEWHPEKCPAYFMPIVGSASVQAIPAEDFLYLPICTAPSCT